MSIRNYCRKEITSIKARVVSIRNYCRKDSSYNATVYPDCPRKTKVPGTVWLGSLVVCLSCLLALWVRTYNWESSEWELTSEEGLYLALVVLFVLTIYYVLTIFGLDSAITQRPLTVLVVIHLTLSIPLVLWWIQAGYNVWELEAEYRTWEIQAGYGAWMVLVTFIVLLAFLTLDIAALRTNIWLFLPIAGAVVVLDCAKFIRLGYFLFDGF